MKIDVNISPELRLLIEAMNFDYRTELSRVIKEKFGDAFHGLEYSRDEVESMVDVKVGSIHQEADDDE